MRQGGFFALLGATTLAAARVGAQETGAGEPEVAGPSVYRTYCTVCHGPGAKGDGPLAESLRFRPPDLTLLARKNGGTFPKDRVLRTVDGRNPVKGHGGQDMPVWGDAFKHSRESFSEKAVRQKIEAVVQHLETLQER
jgi:mono/diheme cytochrome c family protein